MERTQMTFFVSFWDAISSMNKKDQLPVFRAVISYGLYGKHSEDLTPVQSAFFTLMQPVLDASRKKAVNGKQGGSKAKANSKQSKREKENENEIENEIENECKKETAFACFWEAYPRKEGKKEAQDVFAEVTVPLETLLAAIEVQKKTSQWKKDDGQFIPHPATWLNGKRWEDVPVEQSKPEKRQLDEDELAAIDRIMEGES